MARLYVLLLAVIFAAAALVTGCGPRQDKDLKPLVIKPSAPAVEEMDEVDIEEEAEEAEEAEEEETVPGSAVSKAAAIDEAQSRYQAPAPVAVESEAAMPGFEEPVKVREELVLADFDRGEKPNNLGGNFGAWNKDPSDPTQWCKEGFDNVTKHGDKGFSIKLDYNVDSPNPAYNGFWMMLPNTDISKYDTLDLWVKGDPDAGYTTVFKIEIKNADRQIGRYYVSNVTDQWREISIPLSEFKGLIDKTNITEFVIVFEDRMATNKRGVIYVDDIKFVKK